AFAFIKINGQTLEKYLTHVLYYFANPKTRIWAKELSVPLERISNRGKRRIVLKSSVGKEEISRSKLHELSTLLDTSSRNYAVSNEPTESKSGSSAEPTPREGSVSTDSRS
ncbi:PrgI family protein, partial [Patescibacteria group bacterium]|nr:PrgI family protein [Patescibacteria group bacterium]